MVWLKLNHVIKKGPLEITSHSLYLAAATQSGVPSHDSKQTLDNISPTISANCDSNLDGWHKELIIKPQFHCHELSNESLGTGHS